MGATFDVPSGGSDIKRLDGGMYPAVCIQVVELGTHDNDHPQAKIGATKKEILLVFETDELMDENDEGKRLPYVVSIRMTNSLGERSNLYKALVSWRGKKFTDDELRSFSVGNILGKPCLLNISKEKKGDREYNNIKGFNPLMKGQQAPEPVNELIDFGIHDIEQPVFKKLWPWVQKIIMDSYEAKALGLPDIQDNESEKSPF